MKFALHVKDVLLELIEDIASPRLIGLKILTGILYETVS